MEVIMIKYVPPEVLARARWVARYGGKIDEDPPEEITRVTEPSRELGFMARFLLLLTIYTTLFVGIVALYGISPYLLIGVLLIGFCLWGAAS